MKYGEKKTTEPFERLQRNILFYNNKNILTIFKKIKPNNVNGNDIINKLKIYLSDFPPPIEIQLDNESKFSNK